MNRSVTGDAPEQSFRLIRRLLPKFLHPYARGLRKRILNVGSREQEPFRSIASFTQVARPRQQSILDKAAALVSAGVKGDFVECGVLDGGTAALLAYAARTDTRRVHLFDAWLGLPAAHEKDGAGSEKWVGDVVGSPNRVRSVLRKVGANEGNVIFHRGWFSDTIPVSGIEAIAFLHVDCDFYEPTLFVLQQFAPKVVSGGYVQIDDYSAFQGSRLAVDEYLAARPELALQGDGSRGGAVYFRVP